MPLDYLPGQLELPHVVSSVPGKPLVTGARRHKLSDRGHDLYETPPEATIALIKTERLPAFIWEPACGPGAIVEVLRRSGHNVMATDLIDYGCNASTGGIDFLQCGLDWKADAIVTNPPFKIAGEFVAKALELAPKVYLLLRLGFMESVRRTAILENGMLARVHVFKRRLPMMHRHGWVGNKASSSMAFAWFAWDRDSHGPTIIDRIDWEPYPKQIAAAA